MNQDTAKKTSQGDWHPAYIKAALHEKGITFKALALSHGLKDSSSMSAALVRSLPANERRIAEALGLHPKDIWPSRYNTDGSHKPQGFHAVQKSTVCAHVRNGNNCCPA